jgi:hypothetical protein
MAKVVTITDERGEHKGFKMRWVLNNDVLHMQVKGKEFNRPYGAAFDVPINRLEWAKPGGSESAERLKSWLEAATNGTDNKTTSLASNRSYIKGNIGLAKNKAGQTCFEIWYSIGIRFPVATCGVVNNDMAAWFKAMYDKAQQEEAETVTKPQPAPQVKASAKKVTFDDERGIQTGYEMRWKLCGTTLRIQIAGERFNSPIGAEWYFSVGRLEWANPHAVKSTSELLLWLLDEPTQGQRKDLKSLTTGEDGWQAGKVAIGKNKAGQTCLNIWYTAPRCRYPLSTKCGAVSEGMAAWVRAL